MASVAPTATPDKSDEENQNLDLESLDLKSNINNNSVNVSISAKTSISSTEKVDGKPNGNSLSLQKQPILGTSVTSRPPGNSTLPYGYATMNKNFLRQNLPPSSLYRKEVLVPPALDDPVSPSVNNKNANWWLSDSCSPATLFPQRYFCSNDDSSVKCVLHYCLPLIDDCYFCGIFP